MAVGGRTKGKIYQVSTGKFGGGTISKAPAAPAPAPTRSAPAPNVASRQPTRSTYKVTPAPRRSAPTPVRGFAPVGGGGGGFAAMSAPAAPRQSDDDYLASGSDAAYTAQLAALAKALADNEADITAQTTKYNVDYGDTVKNLGWIQDDPATKDVNEGAWNFKDLNTAAGRSFQNQQNDFAGRGLLQSSLYGTANDNLTRSLNDQLTGINTGKQNFMNDLDRQKTSFQNDNKLSQQQARAEAIFRRSQQV